ncbi:murein L,D-transpeptidase [Enterovirga sp. DB1703]|uniref:Murein L,D-transpeptidase n=2 Tax=Enterovirga aerilata TaxID=2730920 RepID=A0A849IAW9_9HYPH|nr:murein L,D-transpeptidase [Enterovirga sp. DB1703]
MSEKGMTKSDPILVRVFKKESELEVWKRSVDGHYAHLKTYPICRWSGQLGPKRREGDRQAPEGFYTITPAQMNPNSSYYLSFDTGYPNAYDRAHGGTGSYLMVHGSCSSRGCYAMTDEGIAEVYALAREAFAGGQKGFQFQAYPFRMTAENLAKFRHDPNMPYWRNLKEGNDVFEITKREAKVAVCNGRYAFNTVANSCTPDPTLAPALAQKEERDRQEVAELIAKGTPAVRLVYADGGQHESFRQTAFAAFGGDSGFAILDSRKPRNLGDVSRPEALAQGPQEIPVEGPAAAGSGRGTTLLAAASTRKPAAAARVASSRTAEPAPIVVAKAEPETANSAADSRPFYERMLGGVFGRNAEPAKPAEPVAAASGAPASAASPLPPRRKSVSAVPAKTAPAAPAGFAKPQASAARPEKHASAAGFVQAGSVGPTPNGFVRN